MADKLSEIVESPIPILYGQSRNYEFTTKDYDDIVQKDDFKKGNEEERISRLTALSNGSYNGVYDFPDGNKIDKTKSPSDIELALRSGTLDKADVDELSKKVQEDAKNEQEQAEKDKALADAKALSDARQDFLDTATGFKKQETKSDE